MFFIYMYISQNKGKESENSYQKLKRSLKDKIDKDGHASRNISIQFPCVCVCLSFCDLFNSW